jgi:hypothetical protein
MSAVERGKQGFTPAGTGQDRPAKWYGLYLGRVIETRLIDIFIRAQIPQLMGDTAATNWARPMGFNVVGQEGGFAPFVSDVTGDTPNLPGSHFGGFEPDPSGPGRSIGYSGFADQPTNLNTRDQQAYLNQGGPGPPVNTIVLMMFIAGDINQPVYALTSQTFTG